VIIVAVSEVFQCITCDFHSYSISLFVFLDDNNQKFKHIDL